MTLSIWKFPLTIAEGQTVRVPRHSQLLTVQLQHGTPQLWAVCDTESKDYEYIKIWVRGTGNQIEEEARAIWQYLGTVQVQDGDRVWHFFCGMREGKPW